MGEQTHAARTQPPEDKLTLHQAREAVNSALRDMFREQSKLFWLDAGECCLAHQFAKYLERYLPFDMDCEYNRDGHKMHDDGGGPTKLLKLYEKHGIQPTFPDVINHKRGTAINRLVAEVKRTTNRDPGAERDKDRLKLRIFTSRWVEDLGTAFYYDVGLFLDFRTGRHVAKTNKLAGLVTWFQDGRQLNDTPEVLEETDTMEPDWND